MSEALREALGEAQRRPSAGSQAPDGEARFKLQRPHGMLHTTAMTTAVYRIGRRWLIANKRKVVGSALNAIHYEA